MNKLKCLFGFHKFKIDSKEPTGFAVCDWGMNIVCEIQENQSCVHCGKKRIKGGLITPGHRTFHPEWYNEHGRPINPKTKELLPAKKYGRW